jgi:hypothetical protein
MMSGIVDQLDYMKDDEGLIYYPTESINTIQTWDIQKGYQVYMNETATLTIMGSNVNPAGYCLPITGMSWYIISYLPDSPLAIDSALYSLRGNILLVKDMYGNIYYPAYGINQIVTMQPGQAYQIILYSSDTLCYPEDTRYSPKFMVTVPFVAEHKYNCDISGTGSNSTLIINNGTSDDDSKLLRAGDEIAVFNKSGMIIGCGVVGNGNTTITVWGDNNRTSPAVEGALMNEELTVKIWDQESNNEYSIVVSSGADLISGKPLSTAPKYHPDGIWLLNVVKNKVVSSIDDQSGNSSFNLTVSPNPATENAVIGIDAIALGDLKLKIMSISGRILFSDEHKVVSKGLHTYNIDLSELNSGVYLLVVEINGITSTEKIVVVK